MSLTALAAAVSLILALLLALVAETPAGHLAGIVPCALASVPAWIVLGPSFGFGNRSVTVRRYAGEDHCLLFARAAQGQADVTRWLRAPSP